VSYSISARPHAPIAEHHRVALGIGEARPRLSWRTDAPRNWRQVAYELAVEGVGRLETSGRVDSAESVLVGWASASLISRERVRVRVRVWGVGESEPSPWSDRTVIEAGLLERNDWLAKAIGSGWVELDELRRPPVLRRTFATTDQPVRARLYATAHGVFEIEINGQRVGDEALAPGYTDYHERLVYSTFDVTPLIRPGENVIGVRLADGWFRGRFGPGIDNYGSRISAIAQLEMEGVDGERNIVVTDGDWFAAMSGIQSSSLYDGEHFDARAELRGWSSLASQAGDWTPVRVDELPAAELVAPDGPPIRATREVAPVATWTAPSGARLVDFGQNLVGRVRLQVHGRAGDVVHVRHAEVLEHGEICVRPLRSARATDTYVLAGEGAEAWEPIFTLHGFRYAELTGTSTTVTDAKVTAVVYHTDLEPTGSFESSDPLLNKLHQNIVWSLRGNFVGIPTDCPQRDERYGWTGDLQLFAPTASFLYDCSGMLRGWLRDLALEQSPDGVVPWIVPAFGSDAESAPTLYQPAALWGDAAVLVPWALYRQFGDRRILEDQYPSARAWVDMVARRTGDSHLWTTGHQFGDWLDPAAPPESPDEATTDRYLVATAYHAHSARTLAAIAEAIGESADAQRFSALADSVAEAFRGHFGEGDGRLTSDTQTAYALALTFGLYSDPRHVNVAQDRLVKLIEENGYRIGTGLAGTAAVADALSGAGRTDVAYRLLLEKECPSWLYTVIMGATTIWERWDSMLPDGSVNPGEMTSFNHYALGAIGDWMHRVVAGVEPIEPGYRSIRFRPRPGGGLTSASARHESPYGETSIRWRIEDETLRVVVTVPVGATGIVDLPGQAIVPVGPGAHDFETRLIDFA
jgi:alpha-L-rhamnosidase